MKWEAPTSSAPALSRGSSQRKLYKLGDADFEKKAGEWIKSLPWKKCIIAYVDVPDHTLLKPET